MPATGRCRQRVTAAAWSVLVGALHTSGIGAPRVHQTGVPDAPPLNVDPDVPPMLDDIVLQLLAKKPEERPSSAKEAARLLKECLQNSLNLKPPEFLAEDDEPTEPTAKVAL